MYIYIYTHIHVFLFLNSFLSFRDKRSLLSLSHVPFHLRIGGAGRDFGCTRSGVSVRVAVLSRCSPVWSIYNYFYSILFDFVLFYCIVLYCIVLYYYAFALGCPTPTHSSRPYPHSLTPTQIYAYTQIYTPDLHLHSDLHPRSTPRSTPRHHPVTPSPP